MESSPEKRRHLHLLYHELRAGSTDYSYVLSPEDFARHLGLFAQARASNDRFYPQLTFDDGHISDHDLAAPLLASHGIAAHFFITVGWTGVKPGYMGWPELRALKDAGHMIGAHGWSHTLLTHLRDNELRNELVQSRLALEDKLGMPVTTMSLPGGRQNARVLAACAAAGYDHVFTSIPALATMPLGPSVGRVNVLAAMQPAWLEQLLDPATRILASMERRQRRKDLAKSLLGDRLYEKLWSAVNRREEEDPAA